MNTTQSWRMIVSGTTDPSLNMGIDYALWESVRGGDAAPALRFYEWKPPSVSIGYNQSPETLVHTEFCRENGFGIVRRPTGGSAIFHDIELTYSFCGHEAWRREFARPLQSYLLICEGLRKVIGKLGVPLEVRGFSEGETSYTRQACFVLSSRHDLVWHERKIVGSAQKRDRRSFLQHGSILLDIRRDAWDGIFREPVDYEKITCLRECLQRKVTVEELIPALRVGFEEIFGVSFEPGAISDAEQERAESASADIFPRL